MGVVSSRMTMPPSTGHKGVTEWFGLDCEKDVSHMLWPLQLPDLNTYGRFGIHVLHSTLLHHYQKNQLSKYLGGMFKDP